MSSRLAAFLQQLPEIAYIQKVDVLPQFIVIEGLDGSGSSTQARLLEQNMLARELPCERSTEPSNGSIGRHIRQILQGGVDSPKDGQADGQKGDSALGWERQHLPQYFAADRAEHIFGVDGIAQKVQQGSWCISERYLFSSLVYQALDPLGETELAQVWQLNCAFPLPQYFIYLDIGAEQANQRISYREQTQKVGREIFEQTDFLSQVGQAYQAVLERFRQMNTGMQIHQLSAAQDKNPLQRQIQEVLGL